MKKDEYKRMRSKSPDRLQNWILVKQENDSIYVFEVGVDDFILDEAPLTGISVSSWQAGLYSGILNRLDHDRLTKITQIYEWVEKDIGLNERDVYEMIALSEILDINTILDFYERIIKIQQMKLDRINSYSEKIDW